MSHVSRNLRAFTRADRDPFRWRHRGVRSGLESSRFVSTLTKSLRDLLVRYSSFEGNVRCSETQFVLELNFLNLFSYGSLPRFQEPSSRHRVYPTNRALQLKKCHRYLCLQPRKMLIHLPLHRLRDICARKVPINLKPQSLQQPAEILIATPPAIHFMS